MIDVQQGYNKDRRTLERLKALPQVRPLLSVIPHVAKSPAKPGKDKYNDEVWLRGKRAKGHTGVLIYTYLPISIIWYPCETEMGMTAATDELFRCSKSLGVSRQITIPRDT